MSENMQFLKCKRKYIKVLMVIILLNVPGGVINALTIYNITHSFPKGDFVVLSYSYTLIDLFLCAWGILFFKKSYNFGAINIYAILCVVFFKDLILLIFGSAYPFKYNSWEMYLAPLIGMSCCSIAAYYLKKSDLVLFMDGLIAFNFVYQILFIITGRVGDSGRVPSISQGYGSVGYMCALHIMYCLLIRQKNRKVFFLIMISFFSLILSGSRFSLLIVLIGVILFIRYIVNTVSERTKRVILSIVACLFIVLLIFTYSSSLYEKYDIINRMSKIFRGKILENILKDQSIIERVESIKAGCRIMQEYPLGISNSFIDLQGKTIDHGFYAFPHSTILAYYLMWGPIFLYCVYWIIKQANRAFRIKEKGIFYYLIFLVLIMLVYGGIETAPKVYAYYFCMLSSINMRVNKARLSMKR